VVRRRVVPGREIKRQKSFNVLGHRRL
jgi:hypothetical protein